MIEYVAAMGLIAFFISTIFKELKMFNGLGDSFPIAASFIPSWSFFAPNPYHTDYYILYRSFKDDSASKWQQAYQISPKRSYTAILWYPDKLFLKSVVDIAIDLVRVASSIHNKKKICLSIPYLHTLNFIQSLVVDSNVNVDKIQFVIMTRVQNSSPEMVFLSETHPVK